MYAMALIHLPVATVPLNWSVYHKNVPREHFRTKMPTVSALSQQCAQRIFAGMGPAVISSTVAVHLRSDANTPVTVVTFSTV